MLQPNLEPSLGTCSQPALVTVCLTLGVCPPPVFPQQGQAGRHMNFSSEKPFSTQGGISMLPAPPLLFSSKDAGSSFFPFLILHFFFLLPPFLSPLPLFFLFLLSRCLLSRSLSHHLFTVSRTHFCDSAQPSEPRKDHSPMFRNSTPLSLPSSPCLSLTTWDYK